MISASMFLKYLFTPPASKEKLRARTPMLPKDSGQAKNINHPNILLSCKDVAIFQPFP